MAEKRTEHFIESAGPILIKKKFPDVHLEIPKDLVTLQKIDELVLEEKSNDEIIERIFSLKIPGERLERTFFYIKSRFGEKKAIQLLKANQKYGELTADLFEEILNGKHTGNDKTSKASKSSGAPRKGEQFIPLRFDIIDDPQCRQFFKSKYLTYAFLRRYILRRPAAFETRNSSS